MKPLARSCLERKPSSAARDDVDDGVADPDHVVELVSHSDAAPYQRFNSGVPRAATIFASP